MSGWEPLRFLNFSILTDRRSFSRGLRSKRGRIPVRCSKTLYAVTDKIGSYHHRRSESTKRRRDECRSRRRSLESAIRMSFLRGYLMSNVAVVVVFKKHEFSERQGADYNHAQNHVILHGVCHVSR